MNPAGDYSSSYLVLYTSTDLSIHEFSFAIGRGNDLVCSAAIQIAEQSVGKNLAELTADMGKTWRYLVDDSQLR
jgi:L-galactonate dehydratase